MDADHFVDCNVLPGALRETFTTTVSLFLNLAPRSPVSGTDGGNLTPIPVRLSINSRPGPFEVVSSPSGHTEGEVVLQQGENAVVRFRSIRQEERRDWYLVIIGAFVAFGAALLLESLRPYIEVIGES